MTARLICLPPHLAFTRDFILHRHWTPAPLTGLAVLIAFPVALARARDALRRS